MVGVWPLTAFVTSVQLMPLLEKILSWAATRSTLDKSEAQAQDKPPISSV
jgi:hypothetical protein